MSKISLPFLVQEDGIAAYFKEIQKIPILSAEEEYSLAMKCKQEADITAAHRLVTSHLKLVAKIAMQFRSYGLPMMDLIAEGNIGLMHAVKKFDPEMGYRLSTYAIWWIKATIQDYILKSWSLVKIGTSAIQKKLFFNLQKAKKNIESSEKIACDSINAEEISEELGVEKRHIDFASHSLSSTISLNANAYSDNETIEIADIISASEETQENIIINQHDNKRKLNLLVDALNILTDREKNIVQERHLKEKPSTLEMLSAKYEVSRERIRQIEEKALKKLKDYMQTKY